MGIRIHKAIGWGFYGKDKKDLVDLCPDESYWNHYIVDNVCDFIQWVIDENKGLDILRELEPWRKDYHSNFNPCWEPDLIIDGKVNRKYFKEAKHNVNYLMINEPEYAKKPMWLFLDPFTPQNYRYDDLIDYYEAKDGNEKILDLTPKCGIYPYVGMIKMYDHEKYKYKDTIDPAEYNILTGRWEKKMAPTVAGEELEYLLNGYRPQIPDSILLLTHYFKIFKDWKNTVQQLRPMIYTYWE